MNFVGCPDLLLAPVAPWWIGTGIMLSEDTPFEPGSECSPKPSAPWRTIDVEVRFGSGRADLASWR